MPPRRFSCPSYGRDSETVLNLLSASVGAVLAPLAVASTQGDFRLPLLGSAALGALLLVPLLALPNGRLSRETPLPSAHPAGPRVRLILGGFVLLFLAYVTVEGGVGSWG